jgi:hypothetical protein
MTNFRQITPSTCTQFHFFDGKRFEQSDRNSRRILSALGSQNRNQRHKMNVFKAATAIAVIGCVGLTAAHAADKNPGKSGSQKRSASSHRVTKSSSNRNSSAASSRRRASATASRARDRSSRAKDETRNAAEAAVPGDLNDQAQLPRREDEEETDDDGDNQDANGILLGTSAPNDGGE